MLVVLDTNVLVSGLLTPQGTCARLLGLFRSNTIVPCYDARIFIEYGNVLFYDRFPITDADATHLLNAIRFDGCPVIPEPLSEDFPDESDRPFFEVATSAGAPLITGNLRHYPKNDLVIPPATFLKHFEST